MSRALLIALATLAVGCSGSGGGASLFAGERGPGGGRGPRTPRSTEATGTTTAPPRTGTPRVSAEERVAWAGETPRELEPIVTTETTVTQPEAPPVERDLGDELREAMGDPSACVSLHEARSLGGTLRIRVSARVMSTGRITRAEVSASGLGERAHDCLQRRAEGLSLRAPVEGAPRAVDTTLTYEVTTREGETTTRYPDDYYGPGAVRPGVALPAIGARGRPEGSVEPSLTQPAIGAEGRPEGSVEPSLVLPAIGGGGSSY